MAANAPGEVSAQASLHAMASYGDGSNAHPGHVMIVEEMLDGNRARVSEMNVDTNWQVANADEYRDSTIVTMHADGLWYYPGGQRLSFAPLPG